MSTTQENRVDSPPAASSSGPSEASADDRHSNPSGGGGRKVMLGVLALAVLGGGGFAVSKVVGLKGDDSQLEAMTYDVSRGKFVVTLTEDGNVESAANVDIKCRVTGGGTVQWIIPDGTTVTEGEEIVRLEQSQIEDQVRSQRIVYEKALSTKLQAEGSVEAAKISIEEYIEGTFKKEQQDLESAVTIAQENLRNEENLLAHTEKMLNRGYVTPLQLEAQEFAVKRTNLELESALAAKEVHEKYTKAKILKDLGTALAAAQAQLRSEDAALELEKGRLDRLEQTLLDCVIKAPQSGMIVYANDNRGGRFGSSQSTIEEGAMVREQQTIARVPDLTNMQVRVTVHETKVDLLRRGMPARITIQDKEYRGTVISVATQPEAAGFMSANIKEYATIVKIEGETRDLKPGMTAEVEILINELDDVVTVPVAAVAEVGGKFYSWKQTPRGPEKTLVALGSSNDKLIEIKDGLKEGDVVLLNVRNMAAAEGMSEEVADVFDRDRFGASDEPAADEEAAAPRGGPRGEGGPRGDGTARGEGGPRGDGAGGGGPRERGGPGGGGGFGGGPGGGGPGGPGGGGGGRRSSGGGGGANLMQFDQDGDGRVTREEVPEQMSGLFDRLDDNGDGAIDSAEIEAMRARREAGGPGGGGGGFGGGGRGGPGGGGGPRGGGPGGGGGRPGGEN